MNARAQSSPPMDRLAVSVEEAAQMLGIGRSKVFELLKEGSLPSIRIGRRRLISCTEIRAFLERVGTATTSTQIVGP